MDRPLCAAAFFRRATTARGTLRIVSVGTPAVEDDRLSLLMSERWLRDVALFGTMAEVRDGVDAWREAGVRTVVLVPSSTRGNQRAAYAELFHADVARLMQT